MRFWVAIFSPFHKTPIPTKIIWKKAWQPSGVVVLYCQTNQTDRYCRRKEASRNGTVLWEAAAEQFPLWTNVLLPDWEKGRAARRACLRSDLLSCVPVLASCWWLRERHEEARGRAVFSSSVRECWLAGLFCCPAWGGYLLFLGRKVDPISESLRILNSEHSSKFWYNI